MAQISRKRYRPFLPINQFQALCVTSTTSVLIDLTILFVYDYQNFQIFNRRMWQMENALLIIRNVKNIAMMLLPIATMTVAYLLYNTLNRKQLWGMSTKWSSRVNKLFNLASNDDLSLLSEACFVMSRAFWVIRVLFSALEAIPAVYWWNAFFTALPASGSYSVINNIIPCLSYTISCLLTPWVIMKPDSQIVSYIKMYFITASLIITMPSAFDLNALSEFYTIRSILAATLQQIIPIADFSLTTKAIKY